nr:hypothetical protein [uncultured Desulfosarcina sp.]
MGTSMFSYFPYLGDNGDVYVFILFLSIRSNPLFFSICSPRFEERLAAGWLILSRLAISMVVIPSFRCAQKHSNDRAWTVWGDFPQAVTGSGVSFITLETFNATWSKSIPRAFKKYLSSSASPNRISTDSGGYTGPIL